MLGRTLHRTFALLSLTTLFAVTAHAATPADSFIASRKSASAPRVTAGVLKGDVSAWTGKVVEISGVVTGTVSNGGATSFILESGEDSVMVDTKGALPQCVSHGNTIRALVKVEPSTAIGAPPLTLMTAIYDAEIAAREQQLAVKPKPKAAAKPQKKAAYTSFDTARLNRSGLSSRAMAIYEPYRQAIARFNPRLTNSQLEEITKSILAYSERYGVDPRLVIALIVTESGFRPTATSRAGAMGLCQLMPGTARGLGVSNAYDPSQNIEASIKLMRGHIEKYGDLSLALSAYNAGPGAVKKHGGVPPYRETRNYIKRVASLYRALCGR